MRLHFRNSVTKEAGRIFGLTLSFEGTRWTHKGCLMLNNKGMHFAAHDIPNGWWRVGSITWRGHLTALRLENGVVYDDLAGKPAY